MRISDWSSDVCSSDLALDAEVLVYPGDDLVVHVEMLPIGHVGDGGGAEGVQRSVALAVHPVAEAVGHVLDDLEALVHGGRADLPLAGAPHHEHRRVAPVGDSAHGGDGPAGAAGVAGGRLTPVQGR